MGPLRHQTDGHGFVIVLDDADLEALRVRKQREDAAIGDFLTEKLLALIS